MGKTLIFFFVRTRKRCFAGSGGGREREGGRRGKNTGGGRRREGERGLDKGKERRGAGFLNGGVFASLILGPI